MTGLTALAAFGVGAAACPLYYLLRAAAKKIGHIPVGIVLDVLFGMLTAAALVGTAFLFNDGIVSLYALLFAACGFLLARVIGLVSVDIFRRRR